MALSKSWGRNSKELVSLLSHCIFHFSQMSLGKLLRPSLHLYRVGYLCSIYLTGGLYIWNRTCGKNGSAANSFSSLTLSSLLSPSDLSPSPLEHVTECSPAPGYVCFTPGGQERARNKTAGFQQNGFHCHQHHWSIKTTFQTQIVALLPLCHQDKAN